MLKGKIETNDYRTARALWEAIGGDCRVDVYGDFDDVDGVAVFGGNGVRVIDIGVVNFLTIVGDGEVIEAPRRQAVMDLTWVFTAY